MTPPTTFVPYSRQPMRVEGPVLAHALDEEPRVPVDEDAHRAPPAARDDLAAAASVMSSAVVEVEAGLPQHRPALLLVVALHAHDHRHLHRQVAHRGDDALGEDVAAQDAAEDVDEDRLHVGVGEQDAEGVLDLLGARAAAHVEEVGGRAAGQLDDVHGGHGEAGPVHHAADVAALELDVVQAVLRGLDLERLLLVEVAQLHELGVAEEGVVVEVDLGVEGEDVARLRDQERVDLDERGVRALEGAVERRA